MLAWNAAFAALFPFVVAAPPEDKRNTLWLNFTHPDCCHPFLNRRRPARQMVAHLRAAYGRHVGEPAWAEFVKRLCAASPEFAELWAEHDVASPASYLKIFRHPVYERLTMTTNPLAVLAVPGTRTVVYTPADEPTRCALASLVAVTALGPGSRAGTRTWAEGAPLTGPGLVTASPGSAQPVRHGHQVVPLADAADPPRTRPRATSRTSRSAGTRWSTPGPSGRSSASTPGAR